MEFIYDGVSDEKFAEGVGMVIGNGGRVRQDGTFTVKGVSGRWQRDGGTLTIVVDDKPWLASWGMIQDGLDKFFK